MPNLKWPLCVYALCWMKPKICKSKREKVTKLTTFKKEEKRRKNYGKMCKNSVSFRNSLCLSFQNDLSSLLYLCYCFEDFSFSVSCFVFACFLFIVEYNLLYISLTALRLLACRIFFVFHLLSFDSDISNSTNLWTE